MPRPPITDRYGTEITVEPLMSSIGPCVDLERSGVRLGSAAGATELSEFQEHDRLTPEQALDLAERLTKAAEFRG